MGKFVCNKDGTQWKTIFIFITGIDYEKNKILKLDPQITLRFFIPLLCPHAGQQAQDQDQKILEQFEDCASKLNSF